MFPFDRVVGVVGLGLTLLIYVLQELKVIPPRSVLWGLLAVSAVTIGYGFLAMIVRILLRFPRRRRAMTLALAVGIGAVFGGTLGGVGWWLAGRSQQTEDRAAVHASRLRPILQGDLGTGDKIEYDMRGDAQVNVRVPAYAKRIEDWRTLVGHFLAAKLPGSGADTRFLHFSPVLGSGVMYEYARLNEMRGNLNHIIDNLESYCRRSRELPDGVAGLVRLRAEGVALRNRTVGSAAQRAKVHDDFEAWDRAVAREMRSVGVREADVGWFVTLDLVPPAEFPHAYDQMHKKDLRELTEKLRRLQEITQRNERRD